MYAYRIRNLNIKHEGMDFLVSGQALYVVEDYEEDGKQAVFESAELYDALGKDGYITSKEVLGYMADSALVALNNDSHLCRVLGSKVID
jgi:hypothetical protein